MFLEINNVEMQYGKFEAVKGVSFGVEKGCIHGLIGENGSGKTTLIKCIMGIFKPNKGEILLDGEVIYENPDVKKRIGYIADSNKPPERLYILRQNALAMIPMQRPDVTHHIGDTENDHNRA